MNIDRGVSGDRFDAFRSFACGGHRLVGEGQLDLSEILLDAAGRLVVPVLDKSAEPLVALELDIVGDGVVG